MDFKRILRGPLIYILLGVAGGAVVAGSYQGFDQSWLLATLTEMGPGWVGVAQVPPDIPDEDLVKLTAAGVRALRFNMFRGQIENVEDLVALATRAHRWRTLIGSACTSIWRVRVTRRRLSCEFCCPASPASRAGDSGTAPWEAARLACPLSRPIGTRDKGQRTGRKFFSERGRRDKATAAAAQDYMDDMTERPDIPRIKSCPICGKPAAEKFRPFCGKRCADVDLNRWFSEVYVVPVKDEDDEDGVPGGKGDDHGS